MPIISLLSDFGLLDAYVGIMHAVLHERCPGARLIDCTHAIARHDIRAAAWTLAAAWRAFPAGTVHLAVVDPGVGGARAMLAAAVDGHCFVAPDNGLLSLAFARHPPQAVHRIVREELFRQPVSETFHGRDCFAPVAGAIAAGLALEEVGPPQEDWVVLDGLTCRVQAEGILGEILHIDHFGNCASNIPARLLAPAGRDPFADDACRILIGGQRLRLSRHYAAVALGEPLALIGSDDHLEIAVNQGHAATRLGLAVGQEIQVLAS